MSRYLVTASIVLYRHDEKVLKAIHSFLEMPGPLVLYLIDNSPDDAFIHKFAFLQQDERIQYIFNNKNVGYGAAHNIALRKALGNSKYHLVLNPDVEFERAALEKSLTFMEQHDDIGLLMPRVLYPDGSLQYLCKMMPTPFDLIMRRFIPGFLRPLFQQRLDSYELKHKDFDQIMDVPNLSGCFMLMRCKALETVGLFDEGFFMYLEDTDLSRRINSRFRTVYYPHASIVHHYEKGSYKSNKLLKYHIRSAFHYFNKWGWLVDAQRSERNQKLK